VFLRDLVSPEWARFQQAGSLKTVLSTAQLGENEGLERSVAAARWAAANVPAKIQTRHTRLSMNKIKYYSPIILATKLLFILIAALGQTSWQQKQAMHLE